MVFFSIIIPVYKVEDYLQKCVDSILIQDFKSFEIILVDDGSPDGCPLMCDDYALQDQRIKVIHKQNEGLSAARNDGIKISEGSYLIFVDSDDYWEGISALQSIYDRLEKSAADLLLFGYKILNVRTGKFSLSKTNYNGALLSSLRREDAIAYLFDNKLFPGSAWVTVTRRELIANHAIFFEKGLIAEDTEWLINLFSYVKSVDSVNDIFYVYLKNRTDSISNSSGVRGVKSLLFIMDRWVPKFLQNKNDKTSRYFLSFLGFHFSTLFLTYAYLSNSEKEFYKESVNKYYFLFDYTTMFKVKVMKIVLNVFGIKFGSVLLRKMYQFIK